MADRSNTIVEGPVKYRDGKKWRSRWCVVRKQSPVADRLHVILFKDIAERNNNINLNKLAATIPNEDFYTIEQGFPMDKEQFVLCIICQNHVLILAFPTKDAIEFWTEKIKKYLGNDVEYAVLLVRVPGHSKLTIGPVRLHIQNQRLYLTMSFPPKLLWSWHLCDLKKFGVIEKKFCFEGGSRCGKGSGIHAFATDKAHEINARIEETTLSRSQLHHDSTSRSSAPHRHTVNRRSTLSQQLENFKPAHPGVKDFDNKEVDGDLNFRSDALRDRSASHPVATSSQSALDGWDKRRAYSTYDVPPSIPRRVESFSGTRCVRSDTMLDVPTTTTDAALAPELPPRGSAIERQGRDVPKLPPRGKKTHSRKRVNGGATSVANLVNKTGYVNSICDAVVRPASAIAPPYDAVIGSDSNACLRTTSTSASSYRQQPGFNRNFSSTSPDSGCDEENDGGSGPAVASIACPVPSGMLLIGDAANLDPSPNKRGSQVLEFVNLAKYDGKDEDYMCDVSTIKKMVENEAASNVVVPAPDESSTKDESAILKKHSYVNVPSKCITYGFHVEDATSEHDYKNIPPPPPATTQSLKTNREYANIPRHDDDCSDISSPYKNVPIPKHLVASMKNGLFADYANIEPTATAMNRLNSTAVRVQPCRGKTLDITVAMNSSSDYINMAGVSETTNLKHSNGDNDYVNMSSAQSTDYMNVGYHRASCLELPPSGKQRRSTTDGAALLAKVVKVASQTTGATAESVPVVAKSEIRVVATDPSEEYIDMSGTNLSQYSGASSVVHSRNNSSVSDSTDCDYIMMKTPPIYDDSADYIDMSGRGCVKLPDAKSGGIAATESSLSSTAIISVNPVDIDVSSKLVSRHTTMSQRLDSAGIDEATIRDLKLPVHGSYVQFLMANHGGEIKRCNSAGMINDKSKTSSIKHTFTRSNSLRLLMNSDDNNSMIFSSLKPSVSMDGCIDAQNIETGYESWSKSQINSDSTDSVTQSDTDLKRFKQRHGYAKMKSTPRPKSMAWGGDNKRHSKLPTFFRRLMRRSSFDRRKHRNHDNVSTDSEDAISPVEATKSVATTTAAETTDENSKTTHKRSESLPRNVFSRKTRSESTDSEITNTPPPSGSGGVDDDDETLVISNESIQSSKSYQSSKKKPSRVKRSMSYHCPGTSSSSSAIIDFVDVSDGRSHSVSNPIPISSPGGSSFRLSRSHGTTVTIPEDNEPVWMPIKIKAKDAAKFGHAGFDTTSRGAESRGALSSSEVVGDYMDSLSLSSHGSSDAHAGGRHDDILKTSPAATVLRPRSGKQYQKLDRKKLAEDLNCNGDLNRDSTQTTPISPTSSTSVFTFDQEMNGSPTRNSYFSSHGNDSPKSPHEVAAASRGHKQQRGGGISGATGGDQRIYMNVRESPKMMYMNTMDTPPGTPPQFGVSPQALEQINPLLNYAELDLSPGRSKEQQQQQQQQTTNGKQLLSSSPQLNYADIDLSGQSSSKESKRSSKVKRTVPRDGLTSYAQIDHSATKAAQKANKEHAQFREDNSRKKERKTSSPMVGSKERKSITPVSMIRSRAGSMSSGSQ